MKNVCLVFTMIFLVSCGSTKVRNRGFDRNAKSISIPTMGPNFIEDIKDYFHKKGYKVVSHRGGDRAVKMSDKETLVNREHQTRYLLSYSYSNVELFCMNEGEYQYNISIIDTKTGAEALNVRGKDCESNIPKRLIEAIEKS